MNKRTFEKIYEQNFQKIYRFFILRSLSKENAEDLTSNTFLSFAEHLSQNKKIDQPSNYLYGIAKIKFIEFLKHKYNEVPLNIENINIAEELMHSENVTKDRYLLERHLYNLIDELPTKQRVIMRLRVIDKYKLTEVATKLKKDLNYVKTTQKRAIKKIKELAAKMYTL
ncbi:sigma-70 family RNA polymerase sigma factor [Candidatus Dojkabacteria bacterium]|nr:sigma-70 family RNA polymerase sigma factor [Candidatus Dojkabacteria bacterium]